MRINLTRNMSPLCQSSRIRSGGGRHEPNEHLNPGLRINKPHYERRGRVLDLTLALILAGRCWINVGLDPQAGAGLTLALILAGWCWINVGLDPGRLVLD